jgi:ferredoxin
VDKFSIQLHPSGDRYDCGSHETLLQGMARIGKKGIPVGCLNGGCGVCKVSVRAGSVCATGCMSRAHVSADDEARGVVLACRVRPVSHVELTVLGSMNKALMRNHWGGIHPESTRLQGD